MTSNVSAAETAEDDEVNIAALVGTVMAYRWLVVSLTAVAAMVGMVAAFTATPIYQAGALLQVDEKGKASLTVLKELDPLLGEATSVAAELEILNSRMVLGRAVAKLNLEIVAEPRYLPRLGQAFARRYVGDGLNAPVLGLARYAWGGERIGVAQLEVPPALLDEPLTVIVTGQNAYRLVDKAGTEWLAGRVGEVAVANGLTVDLAELKARPGTEFVVARLSYEEAVNRLRSRFSARERANKSGIIEATLTGPDRRLLPRVLDEIMFSYYWQNLDRRATEAENQLKFLETQLPTLKGQLDAAEAAYNAYRQSRGSVDLGLETEAVLKSLVEVDAEIVKLRQEREELRQGFTAAHPRVLALDGKLGLLDKRRNGFGASVARLPDTQQIALRLRRDVEVSTTLYIGLLSTAQQLRVTKAGTVGEVRIIDQAAVARHPVEPRRQIIVSMALLAGLAASIALALVLRALRVTVDDPETIEKLLRLPVYASIPHSKAEDALAQRLKKVQPGSGGGLLALTQPDDDAVESLRSLRTTVHFAMLNAPRRSVLFTGPSQDIGKSFISKNFAAVLAQSGQSVVIVDADLRKGHIHKEFGLPREGGVSEYISGALELASIVRPTPLEQLFVVTTGELAPNPSELLMHRRFDEMLLALEGRFDLVVVDAPPALAVSDAAIIGRHVGATLLVARSGRHPIGELQQATKGLQRAGVRVDGIVFNDLDVKRQRYRYGSTGYVYRYSYGKA